MACEKALADYLETKRKIFPRFYFVSAADLVDILSKGSDPTAVLIHIGKIVDSLDTFQMIGDSKVCSIDLCSTRAPPRPAPVMLGRPPPLRPAQVHCYGERIFTAGCLRFQLAPQLVICSFLEWERGKGEHSRTAAPAMADTRNDNCDILGWDLAARGSKAVASRIVDRDLKATYGDTCRRNSPSEQFLWHFPTQ